MKKTVIIIALFCIVTAVQARAAKRPLVEIGPKANLYIGDDVRVGFGAEALVSPMSAFSVRTEVTELSFGDYTVFSLNFGSSLDALIHIPMRSMAPYVHAGMGFQIIDDYTALSIRAGMGLNYNLKRGLDVFVEPGLIIQDYGETDVIFRLSFGGRFGILK
ncbi:hypothetical protein JXB22_10495 [candidate division WOR-3 bacterium]|nr:hypothetical protein [candidate division WOR-3 bacterium]